jgi:hypothetical protein
MAAAYALPRRVATVAPRHRPIRARGKTGEGAWPLAGYPVAAFEDYLLAEGYRLIDRAGH